MSNRVERLRIYLLGSAVLLLLVIGAFVGLARYLRKHAVTEFPLQLARDVLREAANFTYSQSDGHSTRFSIHAAKSVEYKDGKLVLHDFSMTIYGSKGDRNDHIYGDEFEYDKNAQIGRATGVVHIDLQAAGRPGDASQPAGPAKVMHVTTSGLVYLQKLGLASTSEPLEFEAAGLTGHAVGADYSSDSALVTLHSAVSMSGVAGGHALAMTAATAAFDDRSQQALLTHATYESEGRKAAAGQATLYRRVDGTLSRIDARGSVTLNANGAALVAGQVNVDLTAASQPKTAVLTGGVNYSLEQPLRQVSGLADAATVQFDSETQPQPAHATITGAVHATERTRASAAPNEPWSTRELKAGRLDVALARNDAGKAELRDVAATEKPHVTVVNNGTLASRADAGTTEFSADTLSAHLTDTSDPKRTLQVETITGRGSTLLRQVSAGGREQTVAADSLDAKLRPRVAGGAGSAQEKLSQSLLSAVQVGHVQMMQLVPVKPGANPSGREAGAEVKHALADRAVYDGDADRMTLSGGVQLSDAESEIWANQVALDEKTGDAHAAGGVKVSYAADGSVGGARAAEEPSHVLADRAELEHANGTATFYGKPVRLWQGGNQILAPVIALSKVQKTLVAHGDPGSGGMAVRTVLAGIGGATAGGMAPGPGGGGCPARAAEKAGASAQSASAARVTSSGLTYSENTGEANFTGGFLADTVDGTIRASEGVVYLKHKTPGQNAAIAQPGTATQTVSLGGELDHVVATGRVELDKPGLKATGERLVYTANDRTAILTGDAKNPPKAIAAQGTTTGYALRLRSSCDGRGSGSVEVVGSPGQRAHTDARMDDERDKDKGQR